MTACDERGLVQKGLLFGSYQCRDILDGMVKPVGSDDTTTPTRAHESKTAAIPDAAEKSVSNVPEQIDIPRDSYESEHEEKTSDDLEVPHQPAPDLPVNRLYSRRSLPRPLSNIMPPEARDILRMYGLEYSHGAFRPSALKHGRQSVPTDEETETILQAMRDPSFRAIAKDDKAHVVLQTTRSLKDRVLYGRLPEINDRVLAGLVEHLPYAIGSAIQAIQYQGMPQMGNVAEILQNADRHDLDKAAQKDTKLKVHVFNKDCELTLRQIFVLIASDAGKKALFCHMVSNYMNSRSLPRLAEATGVKNPVADLTLLLNGCLVCARDMFLPGRHATRAVDTGISLLDSFFTDIAIDEHGKIKDKDKYQKLKDLSGDIIRTLFADSNLIEQKGTPSQRATYLARATQQTGALSAMMFQAAFEHARTRESEKKRREKTATVLLDITVLAIGVAVAAHAPPALAFIPPALSFVSTDIVPAIVGQTDYTSVLMRARADLKAESAGAILAPVRGHPEGDVPLQLIQERMLYRDMYFSGWDVVADARSKQSK